MEITIFRYKAVYIETSFEADLTNLSNQVKGHMLRSKVMCQRSQGHILRSQVTYLGQRFEVGPLVKMLKIARSKVTYQVKSHVRSCLKCHKSRSQVKLKGHAQTMMHLK